MVALAPALRRKLEEVVKQARVEAEKGARVALQELAAHAAEPFAHLSTHQRALRNRLRARARQLGDRRHPTKGTHDIERLVAECGYEHWHRMLFARFLEENGLLMHPSYGVAVTLQECEELAADEGADTAWELAGQYASRMLPQIFRPDAPVLEVRLPPEHERKLEQLLSGLDPAIFRASDALGWVYQFWQAKKKHEINASEVKIGADELPAVTQLFTEPYMVQFLLQNTLGAWWVSRHKRDTLPIEMPYLRYLDEGTPAAGMFNEWPDTAASIKVLDPSCGSGHFLVAAFEILVQFRMAEEGLNPAEACNAVLRDNLFGLEIDERCTQIAAFALAFAAWKIPESGGYRALPSMHVACSGLAPRAKKEDWLHLAGQDGPLRTGMERLFELFTDAPTLGSLVDPRRVGIRDGQAELGVASFERLRPLVTGQQDSACKDDPAATELGVTAQGIVTAAELLAGSYTLVVTNVPFLHRSKQADTLASYCRENYKDAANDLSTCFVRRCTDFLDRGGTTGLVTPQNWLMQTTYTQLRRRMLLNYQWCLVGDLGPAAFTIMNWWAFNTVVLVFSKSLPQNGQAFAYVSTADSRDTSVKALHLRTRPVENVVQAEQLDNPDHRVAPGANQDGPPLSLIAESVQGIKTGDDPRLRREFWELPQLTSRWRPLLSTVEGSVEYGGRTSIVDWSNDGALMARRQGKRVWGKLGVAVSQMNRLPATLYRGELFDSNVSAIVPDDEEMVPAMWAFVSSDDYRAAVRSIDTTLKVPNATLAKVGFRRERWTRAAQSQYPEGLPLPSSSDPTQWLFHGHPSDCDRPLQVAVARLVGYRWPVEGGNELELELLPRAMSLANQAGSLQSLADDDGIVCLPSVRGEAPAYIRLQRLLAAAFGKDWTPTKQAELLSRVNAEGWTLKRWLQDRFFQQHCELFHQRPFIWHVWDGLARGGFGALVNYHRLDRRLLETLTYTYLGDWIRRQQDAASRGEDSADERLIAAQGLQQKLKAILKGAPPCDIFVRWTPIEKQPIGWDPGLDDGVRLNIRPFMLVGDVKYKGAGILRYKPRIKWGQDRGTDRSDGPWYDLGPTYGGKKGARINDHHLTLDEKRRARDANGADQ